MIHNLHDDDIAVVEKVVGALEKRCDCKRHIIAIITLAIVGLTTYSWNASQAVAPLQATEVDCTCKDLQ